MGSLNGKTSKVLYLSYDGLTDALGQSQILPYIIGLSQKGYAFTIISFEKPDKFKNQGKTIAELCRQQGISWVPLIYHKTPPVLSTLFDVWLLWREVKKQYALRSFEIIHCRSYITSLIGIKAKRKWNVKFIFDMRGFWADERVEGGLWTLKSPVYKCVYQFFKTMERRFLEQADHVISLTENAKKEILSWGIMQSSITVIPTCVDRDVFDPLKITEEDTQNQRLKLGVLESDFVLLYLGSWGTWYLTQEMIAFFEEVKDCYPKAKFLIISQDHPVIDNDRIKKDTIVISATRSEIPALISIATVAVAFIKPSFSKKASSATKMGEILAMRIPLISNSGWGDMNEYSTDDCMVLNKLNKQTYRDLLLNGIKCSIQLHPMLRMLSLDYGVSKYAHVYENK